MPYSTYIPRPPFKDPSMTTLSDGTKINANRNNVQVLDFPNDDGAGPTITYVVAGDNITNESRDAQASLIIASLNAQEAGLGALTFGSAITPAPADPSVQALADANAALRVAIYNAQINALAQNNPDVATAFANVQTAQAAVAASAQVGVASLKG